MSAQQSASLLVTEEEGKGIPALGGTHFESEEYQSTLERLIAHSISEQRGDSFAVSAPWSDSENCNDPIVANHKTLSSSQTDIMVLSTSTTLHTSRTKPSLVTFVACTCCILQMGFLWASFLSPSWLDTRLELIVLSSVKIEKDNSQLLNSMTLGSLLGDLLGTGRHWTAVALVLTSLVLPCLCAVSGAVWIIEDRKEKNKFTAKNTSYSKKQPKMQRSWLRPRMFIEYSARIGFSTFFIICILYIGTSPLEIEFKNSRFVVVNQIKGGMASYTLGMILGLSVLALLRFGRIDFSKMIGTLHNYDNKTPNQDFYEEKYPRREVWGKRDLECSWEVHSDELFTGLTYRYANGTEVGKKEPRLRTTLLQNEDSGENLFVGRKSFDLKTENPTGRIETQPGGLSFWNRVALYELALISTVLWIPAAFLPLFRLNYEGVVSDFMSEVSLSFRLKDFPAELWQRGISTGTDRCILFVLESIFVLLVFACPVMANLAAIGTWIFDRQASTICKRLLWILQPFLGTLVFGIALFFSIPAFQTIQVSSEMCTNSETVVSDACFVIQPEKSVGLYVLLVETIALELFIALTLAFHI